MKTAPKGLAALLAAMAAIGPFSIDAYMPAFPAIGAGLGASPVEVQQTLTAYMLPFAFMTLWHGALADALGRRRVLLVSYAIYALASLLCALAGRIEVLWLGRGRCKGSLRVPAWSSAEPSFATSSMVPPRRSSWHTSACCSPSHPQSRR